MLDGDFAGEVGKLKRQFDGYILVAGSAQYRRAAAGARVFSRRGVRAAAGAVETSFFAASARRGESE